MKLKIKYINLYHALVIGTTLVIKKKKHINIYSI